MHRMCGIASNVGRRDGRQLAISSLARPLPAVVRDGNSGGGAAATAATAMDSIHVTGGVVERGMAAATAATAATTGTIRRSTGQPTLLADANNRQLRDCGCGCGRRCGYVRHTRSLVCAAYTDPGPSVTAGGVKDHLLQNGISGDGKSYGKYTAEPYFFAKKFNGPPRRAGLVSENSPLLKYQYLSCVAREILYTSLIEIKYVNYTRNESKGRRRPRFIDDNISNLADARAIFVRNRSYNSIFLAEVFYIACCLLVTRHTLTHTRETIGSILPLSIASRNFLRANGKMGIRIAHKKATARGHLFSNVKLTH